MPPVAAMMVGDVVARDVAAVEPRWRARLAETLRLCRRVAPVATELDAAPVARAAVARTIAAALTRSCKNARFVSRKNRRAKALPSRSFEENESE